MIQVTLPYPPSVNGIWRHAGKKSYLTAKAKDWKLSAAWAVKAALLSGSKPVMGPFNVHLEVGRPDKRKRDLDNLIKVVLDSVKDGGAIRDDSDAQSIHAQWVDDLKGVRVTVTSSDTWISLGDAVTGAIGNIARGNV